MIAFIRKLIKDRRGNALAIACASMPLVVGAAGLAVDTIQWTLWKRQLQRAADSAAIAGVYDRSSSGGSTATVPATVSHDTELNLHTWMALKSGYPDVSYPTDTSVMQYQVEVKLGVQQSLPFSSLFVSTAPTIIATARAASVPAGGDACINARETSASKTGVNITGNAAIYMPDCVIYSNSPSTNSAAAGGSSSVTAEAVAGVGGIQESNNWKVQSYRPYSPAIDDPFANVQVDTTQMKCYSAEADDKTDWAAAKAAGYNCWSSMKSGSNKSIDVPADFGPIYINGGDITLQGDFNCTGCTLVLTNSDPLSNTIGQIKSNAGANNNITAPTSGTFKGIAIYQDRRASDSTPGNKINGNSGSIIQGALYFPKSELDYNGSGTTDAICTMFVARRVNFSGNSATSNKFKKMADCGAYGLPSGGATRMVRLVA
ncbi:MAG TPA: Tad domain-containing protein [Sphingomicrobium sp.]|jgi:Flp pilus assembly protein TadG|nr:Tad domain-containing protein [Sphingomicrobium sp.]